MMIVNCSPAADNAPETHGSLRFAMRAKNVRNAAKVNQVLSAEQLERSNTALRMEVQSLQQQLAQLRSVGDGSAESSNGVDCGAGSAADAEELAHARDQISEAEGRLAEAQAEAAEEREATAAAQVALKEREEELQLLYDMLARFQVGRK